MLILRLHKSQWATSWWPCVDTNVSILIYNNYAKSTCLNIFFLANMTIWMNKCVFQFDNPVYAAYAQTFVMKLYFSPRVHSDPLFRSGDDIFKLTKRGFEEKSWCSQRSWSHLKPCCASGQMYNTTRSSLKKACCAPYRMGHSRGSIKHTQRQLSVSL